MANKLTLKLITSGLLLGSMAAPMIGCVTGSTTRVPKPSPTASTTGGTTTGTTTATTTTTGTTTGTTATTTTTASTGTTATTSTTAATGGATNTTGLTSGLGATGTSATSTGATLQRTAFVHSVAAAANIFDVTSDATNLYWTEKVANNSFVMALRKDGSQQTPTVLLAGSQANLAWGVATDGSNVYFTTNQAASAGTLLSVPVGGGNATTLASGLNAPSFVRLNSADGKLYVAQNGAGDGAVLRFDTTHAGQDAAAARWQSTPGATPFNLRIFGSTVYYTTMSENLGGSGALYANGSLVASGLLNPTDVTYSASNNTVYWTEYDASNGGVRSQSLSQPAGRGTLVAPVPNAAALLGDAAGLVVTRNESVDGGGNILSIDPATGASTALSQASANYPFQLTSDGANLYVTEFNFSQGANGASLADSALLVIGH